MDSNFLRNRGIFATAVVDLLEDVPERLREKAKEIIELCGGYEGIWKEQRFLLLAGLWLGLKFASLSYNTIPSLVGKQLYERRSRNIYQAPIDELGAITSAQDHFNLALSQIRQTYGKDVALAVYTLIQPVSAQEVNIIGAIKKSDLMSALKYLNKQDINWSAISALNNGTDIIVPSKWLSFLKQELVTVDSTSDLEIEDLKSNLEEGKIILPEPLRIGLVIKVTDSSLAETILEILSDNDKNIDLQAYTEAYKKALAVQNKEFPTGLNSTTKPSSKKVRNVGGITFPEINIVEVSL